MGMEYRNVTAPECLAPDFTIEIIEALRPAAHERAQHDRRMLVKGRAKHRRDRQDDMPIDDALVQYFTHLTDPVNRRDLGTP